MYELIRWVPDSQALEGHGRCFIVVLRVVLNNVEDVIFALCCRREDGDYGIGCDGSPLVRWVMVRCSRPTVLH